MFRFLALVPTLQVIDIPKFFNRFQESFSTDYDIDLITVDKTHVDLFFRFSDAYVETWLSRWSGLPGSQGVANTLRHPQIMHVNMNGITIIISDIDRDFLEMERHYVELCHKMSSALRLEYHKIASYATGDDGVFLYTSGIDATPDALAQAIMNRLNRFYVEISNVFGELIRNLIERIKRRFRPVIDKASRDNRFYDDLVDLQVRLNNFVHLLNIVSSALDRVVILVSSTNLWKAVCVDALGMKNLFSQVYIGLELVFKSYSDYLGISGIFATLGGIGVSIFAGGLTIQSNIALEITVLTIGSGIMLLDAILWASSGIKKLVVSQLEAVERAVK